MELDRGEFLKFAGLTGAGLVLFPSCIFSLRKTLRNSQTATPAPKEEIVEYGEFEEKPIQRLQKHLLDLSWKVQKNNSPWLPSTINQETGKILGPAAWTDTFFLEMFNLLAEKDRNFLPDVYFYADFLIKEGGTFQTLKNIKNHDLGYLGVTLAHVAELTGEEKYKQKALEAVVILKELFDEKSQMLFWQKAGPDPRLKHIIDTSFMGIPLLWWAEKKEDDKEAGNLGRQAISAMIKNFQREDGSVYHQIERNEDGTYTKGETNPSQGYNNESSWARGQAWAALGFTLAAKENPYELEFLNAAKKVISFIMENTPEDTTFPFDFGKEVPENLKQYKDTSAQAITATAALELAKIVPDEEKKNKFINYGRRLLKNIVDKHLTPYGGVANGNVGYFVIENYLKGDTAQHPQVELIYADYFTLYGLLLSQELRKFDSLTR